MDFKVGDVVQLKSGGLKMTVCQYPFKTLDGIEHTDRIVCTWFDNENHLKQSVFDVNELIKF